MEYPVPYRPGIPIPPEDLRFRVTGFPDAGGFHYGGKWTLDMFRDALTAVGRDLTDSSDIYDFGCGCGRLTPWLLMAAPHARIHGSDIDDAAVDWLRRHFPQGDFRLNQGLPPLPFHNTTFDLVIGYSVFTHLDEVYQDAWLAELHAVTRPGALLLLTANLDRSWQRNMEASPPEYHEHMRGLRAQVEERGILFYTADGWEEHFPDFYHTTWHTPGYIREHWSRWFDVQAIIEGKSENLHQGVVVLRRGEDPTHVNVAAERYAGMPTLSPASATLPPGRTNVIVSWDTGDLSEGEVWVRRDDDEEQLFAQGRTGTQVADFLDHPGRYIFTLYQGAHPSSPADQGIPIRAQTILTKTSFST